MDLQQKKTQLEAEMADCQAKIEVLNERVKALKASIKKTEKIILQAKELFDVKG